MTDKSVVERIDELYSQLREERDFWKTIADTVSEEFGEEFTVDKARGRWRRSKPKQNETRNENLPEIVLTDDNIETLDELLLKSKVDLDTYFVDHFVTNVWDGKTQIKAWLRRKTPDDFNETEFLQKIQNIVETRKEYIPTYESIEPVDSENKVLFIPCLFDAHTDSPFFSGDYLNVLERLLLNGISNGNKPDRILFPIGNDFGHYDNDKSETTAGTRVQSKSSYLDSVDTRCKLILDSCDLLRRYTRHLDVVVIPGNHDRFSMYWIGKVLEGYYKNDMSVTIMNGHDPRKYYRHGKTLFGFTHGSDEKSMDMVGLMAVEAPLDWAASDNRGWLTGHLHQQNRSYSMLNEKFGVIKRILPSLCNPDEWHILKGYIGNDRAAELLIYNEEGKISEIQLSIK